MYHKKPTISKQVNIPFIPWIRNGHVFFGYGTWKWAMYFSVGRDSHLLGDWNVDPFQGSQALRASFTKGTVNGGRELYDSLMSFPFAMHIAAICVGRACHLQKLQKMRYSRVKFCRKEATGGSTLTFLKLLLRKPLRDSNESLTWKVHQPVWWHLMTLPSLNPSKPVHRVCDACSP